MTPKTHKKRVQGMDTKGPYGDAAGGCWATLVSHTKSGIVAYWEDIDKNPNRVNN